MPDTGVRGGIIKWKANGRQYAAKGDFTYSLGLPKLEAIVGSDGIHGPKSMPQIAFIAGKTTDFYDLDLKDLVTLRNATVILELANGKSVLLREAWYADTGEVSTAEGEIPVRFESESEGEEIR